MGCRVLPEEPSGCQCFASVVRLLIALRVLPQTGGTARRRIPALSFVVPIRPHGEVRSRRSFRYFQTPHRLIVTPIEGNKALRFLG